MNHIFATATAVVFSLATFVGADAAEKKSPSSETASAAQIAKIAPPAGTWASLPKTSILPAVPPESSTGAGGGNPELWSPQSIFDYSGGDLATIKGVMGFLYWGGGHSSTPDDSLYFAPFDGTGPRRLSGPYLAPDRVYNYDVPSETYRGVSRNAPPTVKTEGAPKSRHTYSSLLFFEVNGKSYFWSYGGALCIGSGCGTAATRMFDLSLTYEQAMARPDLGWALKASAPSGTASSASGWDPIKKRVITRSRNFIGAYYPEQDRWENWGMGNAPAGCDFCASVAMDLVGRKMYVIGDRLAEVFDLDTNAYTNLHDKPWAANFVKPLWEGGYPTAPGISWHARTKQIVCWIGGQNLIMIDPATDKVKTITMSGATVSAPPQSGTYGRFRVIPGTDQVVVVNAVAQDVFIGTIPK